MGDLVIRIFVNLPGGVISTVQKLPKCNCRRRPFQADRDGPCLPSCPQYDLLPFRVFAPWIDPKFQSWTTVRTRTPVEAIHASRTGYEPAHCIRATGIVRDRVRGIDRLHYDVDDITAIVEEVAT